MAAVADEGRACGGTVQRQRELRAAAARDGGASVREESPGHELAGVMWKTWLSAGKEAKEAREAFEARQRLAEEWKKKNEEHWPYMQELVADLAELNGQVRVVQQNPTLLEWSYVSLDDNSALPDDYLEELPEPGAPQAFATRQRQNHLLVPEPVQPLPAGTDSPWRRCTKYGRCLEHAAGFSVNSMNRCLRKAWERWLGPAKEQRSGRHVVEICTRDGQPPGGEDKRRLFIHLSGALWEDWGLWTLLYVQHVPPDLIQLRTMHAGDNDPVFTDRFCFC